MGFIIVVVLTAKAAISTSISWTLNWGTDDGSSFESGPIDVIVPMKFFDGDHVYLQYLPLQYITAGWEGPSLDDWTKFGVEFRCKSSEALVILKCGVHLMYEQDVCPVRTARMIQSSSSDWTEDFTSYHGEFAGSTEVPRGSILKSQEHNDNDPEEAYPGGSDCCTTATNYKRSRRLSGSGKAVEPKGKCLQ